MTYLIDFINWVLERTITEPAKIDADRFRRATLGSDRALERSWNRDTNWN
jgi:hypothetical protein